jgi:heme/copper-type cytochrome/quinol oxidase subunit 3
MKKYLRSGRHFYHLVIPSIWPFLAALGALNITLGGVMYMHSYSYGGYVLLFGFIFTALVAISWWKDVIAEGELSGSHTTVVQRGLRIGFILFIVSEVMFFFAFFWAFFHNSLAPDIVVGGIWPPVGIVPFSAWGVPLLNTYILVLSGVTLTVAHHALTAGVYKIVIEYFVYTLILAVLFTCFQIMEYKESLFTISDGIYGSTFFMATGFHGFHVFVGTIFLTVCFVRISRKLIETDHHLGVEAAAWYWHFVDVVWLFLFVCIYWWGGLYNELAWMSLLTDFEV